MNVVIIGAGLAGPLLGQALRRAGIDLTIVERRTEEEYRRSGYRIHLDPGGDLALQACLPRALHQLVRRTAGLPGSGVRVLASDLSVVHEMLVGQPGDADTEGLHLTVDRQTLREILVCGLDDAIRSGVGFDHYTVTDGHRVTVGLDDGTTLEADLLIGADGTGSRVRSQHLPQLEVIEVGQVNIFGRTPLTPETLPDIPPAALDGFSAVLGPEGMGVSLAAHRFPGPPQAEADLLCPGLRLSADDDYLMWVLTLPTAGRPGAALPAGLQDYAAEQLRGWQPALQRLVLASRPDSVHATAVRTSRRPRPWPGGPVTVIGDAAHPMIPAGIGAAVALVDAARLAEQVIAAASGRIPLVDGVASYERAMLRYGFDAVEQSERRSLSPTTG